MAQQDLERCRERVELADYNLEVGCPAVSAQSVQFANVPMACARLSLPIDATFCGVAISARTALTTSLATVAEALLPSY